jgi:hypothetical protein
LPSRMALPSGLPSGYRQTAPANSIPMVLSRMKRFRWVTKAFQMIKIRSFKRRYTG